MPKSPLNADLVEFGIKLNVWRPCFEQAVGSYQAELLKALTIRTQAAPVFTDFPVPDATALSIGFMEGLNELGQMLYYSQEALRALNFLEQGSTVNERGEVDTSKIGALLAFIDVINHLLASPTSFEELTDGATQVATCATALAPHGGSFHVLIREFRGFFQHLLSRQRQKQIRSAAVSPRREPNNGADFVLDGMLERMGLDRPRF